MCTHTHVEERQWRRQSQSVQRRLPRPSDVNTAILRGAPHRDQKYRDLYEVQYIIFNVFAIHVWQKMLLTLHMRMTSIDVINLCTLNDE